MNLSLFLNDQFKFIRLNAFQFDGILSAEWAPGVQWPRLETSCCLSLPRPGSYHQLSLGAYEKVQKGAPSYFRQEDGLFNNTYVMILSHTEYVRSWMDPVLDDLDTIGACLDAGDNRLMTQTSSSQLLSLVTLLLSCFWLANICGSPGLWLAVTRTDCYRRDRARGQIRSHGRGDRENNNLQFTGEKRSILFLLFSLLPNLSGA